jgi:uncharacterized membrane protein YccC
VKLPFGLLALAFSAKSFAAAMLALYLAFRFGLPNPYWALVTVYVVAQPHAGAVLSKAMYRVIGTLAGAIVSIVLVPPLVNAPELLSLAVALWLGFCVFVSGVARSPRTYLFALAGYTTCIIAFPSVRQPAEIFNIAMARVEEITLGILCSGVIHAVVLPTSARALLRNRVDTAITDAARWSADALLRPGDAQLARDRRRLATDVNELHDLLLHAGFEGAGTPLRKDVVRALLAQLERTLPLSMGVDDRLSELAHSGGPSLGLAALIADVEQWLRRIGGTTDAKLAGDSQPLRKRCRALEPAVSPDMGWRSRLELSLLARLSDLVQVHGDALLLRASLEAGWNEGAPRRPVEVLVVRTQRTVDRDIAGAASAALATAGTLFLACLLWIASGWEGGENGVMLAGVFCSIYATSSNPSLLLKNKLVGVSLRLLLGAVYLLIVLPAIDGFPLLVLALAPALILCGALQTVPRYAPLTFNFIIGTLSPNIISERFEPDFVHYVNGGLSTLTGISFALVVMTLIHSLWTAGAVRRTLKAGQLDIARGRYGAGVAAAWRSRMMHRIGLLTARLARAEPEDRSTTGALRDLMTGLSLAQLAQHEPLLRPDIAAEVHDIVDTVRMHFAKLAKRATLLPPETLLAKIDDGLDRVSREPSRRGRRGAMLALLGLRRNLFPAAPAAYSLGSHR